MTLLEFGSRLRADQVLLHKLHSLPNVEVRLDARTTEVAGDATTVPFKQIVIAMGAGCTAALSAFDYLIRNGTPGGIGDVGIAA